MWQVVASCGLELWSVVATTTHHSKGATFVVSCGGLATTHHNPPQLATTRLKNLGYADDTVIMIGHTRDGISIQNNLKIFEEASRSGNEVKKAKILYHLAWTMEKCRR